MEEVVSMAKPVVDVVHGRWGGRTVGNPTSTSYPPGLRQAQRDKDVREAPLLLRFLLSCQ